MNVELRFIKESHFDESKNEEEKRRKISYCSGRKADVIFDLRDEIEKKIRNEFEMGEKIQEEFYPIKELKKNHPALEYKAIYTKLGGEITVWEVYYYKEIKPAPDVVTTLEL